MHTQCSPEQLEFQGLGTRKVVADFSGGRITSDAGSLLLGEVERGTGILRRFAECFVDYRHLKKAKKRFWITGRAARCYRDFRYRTLNSWNRTRRVVGKAEQLAKGENPKFVVTSLSKEQFAAQELYEDLYCARGDMENRIKE